MGWLTWLAIGIQVTFWIVDALAHFLKYKQGETVSKMIWVWEAHHPLRRGIIGLSVAILFTHLVFGIP